MAEMTDNERLDAERKELDLLIGRGIEFSLEAPVIKRNKGLLGSLGKKEIIKKSYTFKIEEPTLSTLDRLSAEQIDLVIDENKLSSDSGTCEARKLTGKHSRRMAKIIAIAVLGQNYIKGTQDGSRIIYKKDDRSLQDLTDFFFYNIKPSKLFQLVMAINTMSNLGDFCHSIRLQSAERTTMPIRIEAKED